DWIKLGMAGNLAGYQLVLADGSTADGAHVLYNGVPAGYTLDPQENVIYVSAHDNETLFDVIQLKAPAGASLADRVRMNNLALSVPMFSQGIAFFHAGDDVLRSKSLDKNSYDSGDWFNKLDWTLKTDNWGVGLPIEGSDRYDIYKPLLADAALNPGSDEITFAADVFQEFLKIRKSSPLFRLQTGEQVTQMVSFLNNGPDQIPGLIVMDLNDTQNVDPAYSEIIALVNADKSAHEFSDASLKGKSFELHPILQNSVDAVVRTAAFDAAVGTFSVPARTTAVFAIAQPAQVATPTAAATQATAAAATPTSQSVAVTQPGRPVNTTLVAILAVLVLAGAVSFAFLARKRVSGKK
ncbi:DUF3372 domain-containing protein, partial [bacterium]|nr:DUF3372 domain-containing protein [bacterium]